MITGALINITTIMEVGKTKRNQVNSGTSGMKQEYADRVFHGKAIDIIKSDKEKIYAN